MAAYDLEEQEQLAEIKSWWKQHGNKVVGALLAASLTVAGWQGWNWYQREQAAQASAIFSVLKEAAERGDSQRVKAASGELLEKFGSTPVAALGALTAARAAFDAGDVKTARAQLGWVVENGKDEARELARLRLATLLIDEKAWDEALRLLDGPVAEGFAARFADVRGDVLAAAGRQTEAAAAWKQALAALATGAVPARDANSPYRELLRLKLEASGETVPDALADAGAAGQAK